jgi:hypothetical protein
LLRSDTRARWPLLLVLGATLLASLPLLREGLPDTHDGLFHFYRAMALEEAVREGIVWPRWFPDFAFGYGQPVLAFYGAGSYYQTLPFALAGGEWALKAATALAFLLSGAGAYGLARRMMGPWPAGLAGAAYVLFPYRLANVYVRGAFAEHWALAILPVLLLLGERAITRRDRGSWLAAALAWAVLIFTHNLSALVSAPLWLAYLVAVAWERSRAGIGTRLRHFLRAVAALPAGGLLTAFYWLPILQEASLVGLGNTFSTDAWSRYLTAAGQTISRSLAYHYFPAQGVAHEYPLGLVTAALLAAAVLAAAAQGWLRRPRWWYFAGLVAGCWALQWQSSQVVWRSVPVLGFVQFPWRLMGPLALGWAVLLGLGCQAISERLRLAGSAQGAVAVVALAIVAAGSLAALPAQTVTVSAEDWVQHMWDHDAAIGQVGATWTAEYVPVWVTVDRSAMPWDPVESDRPPRYAVPPGLRVQVLAAGLGSLRLSVEASSPVRLSQHSFYYPGQVVSIDGKPVPAEPFTDLGLVSVEVPAGRHEVRFGFAPTPVVWLGRVVSALAAAGLALYAVGGIRGAVVAAVAAAAVLVGTAWGPAERPVNGIWTAYEDQMGLAGWQAPEVIRPGAPLVLDLYWLPLTTPQENLKVFVHLEGPDGRVIAQSDGDPVGGYTRTSRMVGGEVTLDRRWLEVPADAPEGRYALYVGLYRWPEVANLTVSEGQEPGAQRVLLGWVELRR